MKPAKILQVALCSCLLGALLVLASPTPGKGQSSLPVVVIDPGHGGRDAGVIGPDGAREKDVCFQLAALLTAALRPANRVLMTREGDYDVDLLDRTGLANHHKADCFISLHAGGSFLHAAAGVTLYSYKPAASEAPDDNTGDAAERKPAWSYNQLPHLTASRKLAVSVKSALENVVKPAPLHVRQAPLRVLQGAAMPAVLIEIGRLTHAQTEKALTSADQLKAYAQAIAHGIEAFRALR